MSRSKKPETFATENRRALLKRAGRLTAVTAPAVALLLAARSRPAKAQVISVD
jgi:hypothetical protein